MNKVTEGFKVFEPDWTCRGFQYKVGQTYEEDAKPKCCERGFHFCEELKDCFNYYPFNPDNKVARIIAFGDIDREHNKCCTNKIQIVEEISWEEVLRLVNLGKGNAGLCNSGNWNSGNWNSGNRNSGDWNSGDWNSGNRNSGNRNSGNRNSGNWNSGNCNSGNWNSGDCNSGNWNSGDWNSGDWNSGDWNKTSFSNGCFNTESPKIYMFNNPSNWTLKDWLDSEQRDILNAIPAEILEWVDSKDMTEVEKELHPEHETTGGFLKIYTPKQTAQMYFDGLPKTAKELILNLPNFDADIFKVITGIDVRRGDK